LGFVGRAFAEQQPELHDEVVRRLEQRLYREAREYWAQFPGSLYPKPSPAVRRGRRLSPRSIHEAP
jgi:hypothetical protein